MRPKGWRNDPAWIAHYQALDDARLKRQIERIKLETELRMINADNEFRQKQPPIRFVPEDVKKFWRGDGWRG